MACGPQNGSASSAEVAFRLVIANLSGHKDAGIRPDEVVVPEKLRLPAAVGLGRRICVVKIARKEIFLDQNLAI